MEGQGVIVKIETSPKVWEVFTIVKIPVPSMNQTKVITNVEKVNKVVRVDRQQGIYKIKHVEIMN